MGKHGKRGKRPDGQEPAERTSITKKAKANPTKADTIILTKRQNKSNRREKLTRVGVMMKP